MPRLDTEIADYVAQCQALFPADAVAGDVATQRRQYRELCRAFARPRPEGLMVRDLTLPGAGAEIAVRVYRPAANPPPPPVLFLHGGGWILGDLESHDDVAAELAMRCGVGVVAVAYRLAPEALFPIPLDDCHAVLMAIAAEPERFGLARRPVVVGGDSAGGNLAAALALKARDDAGPALAGQVLVYPALGGDASLPSHSEQAEAPLLTAADMAAYWRFYLGGRAPDAKGYAKPLTAPSLAGLPPAFLQAAEIDPLRDEATAYADRLRRAGVRATCVIEPGLVHGYLRARHRSRAAGAAFGRLCAAVRGFVSA